MLKCLPSAHNITMKYDSDLIHIFRLEIHNFLLRTDETSQTLLVSTAWKVVHILHQSKEDINKMKRFVYLYTNNMRFSNLLRLILTLLRAI